MAVVIKWLAGPAEYLPVWQAMQAYTNERGADAPDEIWLCEHQPVYTLGQAGLPGLEIVRSYWQGRLPAETFEAAWRKALQDGVVAEPAESVAKAKPPAPAKLDGAKLAAGG